MFKALGNALYKTPWWAVVLMSLFVLTCLVIFALPVQVFRLSEAGATREESRAIQREIDRAFGDNALGFAERIVQSMRERTQDESRRAELDQALEEIATARKDIFNAAKEARRVGREAVKEAAQAAREAARTAAESAREAAREKIESLKEAREEAKQAQKKVGLDDPAALIAFDKAIEAAKESEKAAAEALAQLQSRKLSINLDLDAPQSVVIGPSEEATPPPAVPAVPAPPKTPKAPVSPGKSKQPVILVDPPAPPDPPAPLPPEIREDIHRKVTSDFRRVGVGSALIVTFIPLFIMLLIAKYYIGRSRRAQELAQAKSQEAESANLNRQITEAKLMALQAQVEPHFLYNTLANVQALTEVDPAQANQMTGHLIQYLRAALPKMRENASTIGQEVELVRAYLNILKMRMGERLAFGIDVPPELDTAAFPPLMLPSLVENAIKHGLEPQREGGRIDLVVEKRDVGGEEMLVVIVKDTGRGLSDAPVQAGGGVGLTNIRERLLALFGERARLTLESNAPKGVVATIAIPMSNGAAAPAGDTAGTVPAAPPKPTTFWGKARYAASKTHRAWVRVLTAVLLGAMTLIAIVFVVGLVALATGLLPVHIGGATLSGLEGMAIGTVALLFVVGILAIVALFIVAVLYGLGFLFVALAIGIPLIILISMFPVLLPFALIGGVVYFFWWRKRKKVAAAEKMQS